MFGGIEIRGCGNNISFLGSNLAIIELLFVTHFRAVDAHRFLGRWGNFDELSHHAIVGNNGLLVMYDALDGPGFFVSED